MKIGILTLPLEVNYGGILQAFAMQKVLKKMGHEVFTIDRHRRRRYPSLSIHFAGYFKRLFHHYILMKKTVSVKWNPFISEEEFKTISKETQRFINHNIQLTRQVYPEQLSSIDDEYQFDAYIVGSDQVWLDYYCPDSFLAFVKRPNVKRVFYAASCGKRSIFDHPTKVLLCKKLVKAFSGVSVREESLVPVCKKTLGVDAEWVLDPTLLIDKEEYLEATNCHVDKSPILFSYILDDNTGKESIINAISNLLGLSVVNGNKGTKDKVYPSVDDWIHNLARSEFVITDSFHGTVFAILFNKPFLTIANARRGIARFHSLLDKFGLRERLISETQLDSISKIVKQSIDFSTINSILTKERARSLEYFTKSLNR